MTAALLRGKKTKLRAWGLTLLTVGAATVGAQTGPWFTNEARATRHPALLLAGDQHLVRADFIGYIQVQSAASDAETATLRVEVIVLDAWFNRSLEPEVVAGGRSFTLAMTPGFPGERHFTPGSEAVILISGGHWRQSPFTHRENSIFTVDQAGIVRCHSGNPLYAVTTEGFHCSIAELSAGPPLTLPDFRRETLRARRISADRLRSLSDALDSLSRPIETMPAEPLPGSIESEVLR